MQDDSRHKSPDKSTLLLTGADGQLGFELQRSCPDAYHLIATDHHQLDVTDPDSIRAQINTHRPDWIINAAAYTAVDKAEQEPELAASINTQGAHKLASACSDWGIRMVHVSTDFVFDGQAGTPYRVDAPTSPQSVYGRTKRDGDEQVLDTLGDNALIMRTSWLYSSHGHNFVKTMLNLMSQRDELGIIADQIGTPTWANSLAGAIWQSIEKELTGVHHWSDAGVASWYDFAVAIMEEGVVLGLLSKPLTINPITTNDYPTPAKRPAYSVLDKSVTWKALDLCSEHWRVALRRMMQELG